MDDDDGPLAYYKLTLLALGSGELKIEKVIDPYIFYISEGFEKFTRAIFAQIEPLVEMLSKF